MNTENNKMHPSPPLTCHTATRAWNPTVLHHHIPGEFKKRLRAAAIARGEWRPSMEHRTLLSHTVWDHWGSVLLPGDTERSMYSQPYDRPVKAAEEFANRHGMILTIYPVGPHHPNTSLYIFSIPY